MQHTSAVQPVSVDEAYMDVTGLGDPVGIAEAIRAAIEQETGCTASAGIAANMLLARLATKRAKPNGVFHLLPTQVAAVTNACSATGVRAVCTISVHLARVLRGAVQGQACHSSCGAPSS